MKVSELISMLEKIEDKNKRIVVFCNGDHDSGDWHIEKGITEHRDNPRGYFETVWYSLEICGRKPKP